MAHNNPNSQEYAQFEGTQGFDCHLLPTASEIEGNMQAQQEPRKRNEDVMETENSSASNESAGNAV